MADEEEPEQDRGAQLERSNAVSVTVIFSKTVIGAGVAALPLTDAALGWPIATVFLLLVALTTKWSLDLIVRAGEWCQSASYADVAHKTLNRWWALLLEVSVVLFGLGLMLVYSVVIGDMLVGEGGDGLLCGQLHGLVCSRPFVVAVVTLVILVPLISFRDVASLAFAGWIGVGALLIWAVSTLILVIVAASTGNVQPVHFLPDPVKLGDSGLQVFATICSVIPTLTTAYSCQAAGVHALTALKPGDSAQKGQVTLTGITITTGIYALISIGSYLLFGEAVKADVLQSFTVKTMHHLLPTWLSWAVFFLVRLSFLAGVLTLYPLMMFPTRDGLVRIFRRSAKPLKPLSFYLVTYLLCIAIYAVSVVTPSIKGPIEVIGATAGAVIGFIIPGLLAFREKRQGEEEGLLLEETDSGSGLTWTFRSKAGWILLVLGAVQFVTGIASQAITASS